VSRWEIDEPFTLSRSQSKRPGSAKRDGYDGRTGEKTNDAVAMGADVVPMLGVIPIQKQTVQS
jgi:hypothetical protein